MPWPLLLQRKGAVHGTIDDRVCHLTLLVRSYHTQQLSNHKVRQWSVRNIEVVWTLRRQQRLYRQ